MTVTGESEANEAILRQMAWKRLYEGEPVTVVGVNLDGPVTVADAKAMVETAQSKVLQFFYGDHPGLVPVPEPFDITALPTACVIGPGGKVLFAGDPRSWELQAAITYSLATAKAAPSGPMGGPSRESDGSANRADEANAKRLYDEGWNKLLLGRKSQQQSLRQEGVALLKQCAQDYPDTKAGKQAKVDVDTVAAP